MTDTSREKTIISVSPYHRNGNIENDNPTAIDDIHAVVHLFSLGQILCTQVNGSVTRLCQEVQQVTGNRARLSLQKEKTMRKVTIAQHPSTNIPVQFGHTIYGSLQVSHNPRDSGQPLIALSISHLLAQTCSWLLYTLEQSTFLQSQYQHLEYDMQESLTKREREVLDLMFHGYGQEDIAELLCIAPATVNKHRQHIYEKLGVHCEYDALLAAYQIGILSFFDECSVQEEKCSV